MTEDTATMLQRVYGSKVVPKRVKKAIDVAEFAFCRLSRQISVSDIITICLAVTDEADWADFGKPGRRAVDLDEHFEPEVGGYPEPIPLTPEEETQKPLISEQEKQKPTIVTAPHLRYDGPTDTKPDYDSATEDAITAMKQEQDGIRREPDPPQRPPREAKARLNVVAKVKRKPRKRGRPKKKAVAAAPAA